METLNMDMTLEEALSYEQNDEEIDEAYLAYEFDRMMAERKLKNIEVTFSGIISELI